MSEPLSLGQKLGHTRSIPQSIQVAICLGALVLFVAAWQLDLASVPVLIAGTLGAVMALLAAAHCTPALRSSLTIYEDGLETMVQGTRRAFAYDELTCLAARFTHHLLNHQYVGTRVRIEFSVDGRFQPYVYECEFRRGKPGEQLIGLAIDKCSQAIQRRLLAELEHQGAVRWRDNVSLTAEGLLLTDSASASRLIHYRDIADWKIVDNDLKIWKSGDALPCLVMGNETPNFVPLLSLFEKLCTSTRSAPAPLALEHKATSRRAGTLA